MRNNGYLLVDDSGSIGQLQNFAYLFVYSRHIRISAGASVREWNLLD